MTPKVTITNKFLSMSFSEVVQLLQLTIISHLVGMVKYNNFYSAAKPPAAPKFQNTSCQLKSYPESNRMQSPFGQASEKTRESTSRDPMRISYKERPRYLAEADSGKVIAEKHRKFRSTVRDKSIYKKKDRYSFSRDSPVYDRHRISPARSPSSRYGQSLSSERRHPQSPKREPFRNRNRLLHSPKRQHSSPVSDVYRFSPSSSDEPFKKRLGYSGKSVHDRLSFHDSKNSTSIASDKHRSKKEHGISVYEFDETLEDGNSEVRGPTRNFSEIAKSKEILKKSHPVEKSKRNSKSNSSDTDSFNKKKITKKKKKTSKSDSKVENKLVTFPVFTVINDQAKFQRSLKCFVCSSKQSDSEFDHLLFGIVKCDNCDWKAETCDQFRDRHAFKLACQHSSLSWSFDQLLNYIKEGNCEDTISFLSQYLEDTKVYQKIFPWKDGFEYFESKCEALKTLQKVRCRSPSPSCKNVERNNITSPPAENLSSRCDNQNNYRGEHMLMNGEGREHSSSCENIDRFTRNDESRNRRSNRLHERSTKDNRHTKSRVSETDTRSRNSYGSRKSRTELLTDEDKIPSNFQNEIVFKAVESESKSNSRQPINNSSNNGVKLLSSKEYSSRKRIELKDKFNTVVFGVTQVKDVVPLTKTNSIYDEVHSHIPEYALDNYVIVLRCSDDCPKCYQELGQKDIVTFMTNCGLVIFCCPSCSLYICLLIHQKNFLNL